MPRLQPKLDLRTRLDRDRAAHFVRFLWQRFLDDKCFETAGALSYTTLFALVPLTAAVFGVLAAFPVFAEWRDSVSAFVFRNFVPAAGDVVQGYLLDFAGKASRLTAVGVVGLLVSALLMMRSIEDRFNRIWRVAAKRKGVARFLVYWAVLTLTPILLVAGLAVTSYLFALPLLQHAAGGLGLQNRALELLPPTITWLALFAMFVVIPNRSVRWRHAAVGALVVAVLFELAKAGFALYVRSVPSYQQIYGALAVVPIFLVWIYLSWAIVLLGASLAASLSAFEYRPLADRLPPGSEFLGLLHVLKHFVAAQRAGRGLHSEALHYSERFISDDLLQRYLGDLQRAGLVQRTERGEWVLARSLDTATLAELYEAGSYRLPLDRAAVARFGEGLPAPLHDLLDALAAGVRDNLRARLGDLFPAVERSPEESA